MVSFSMSHKVFKMVLGGWTRQTDSATGPGPPILEMPSARFGVDEYEF